jgi:predicted dehydrogenase
MKLAVLGYGYWGPHLVRNFMGRDDCTVSAVADRRPDRVAALRRLYPGIEVVAEAEEALRRADVDAVAIATPVDTHFPLVKRALEQGKHVVVEKPLAGSVAEAEELVALAAARRRVLMVDHTFLYTGAVQLLKRLVADGSLGRLNYVDSTRINLGLFQHDINVLWDLAAHDVSIVKYLVEEPVESVQAIGVSHTPNGIEDIAYLILNFASGLIAHFNCSWISPVKIRRMLLGGDRRMALYDDMEATEKVKVYDSGVDVKSDEERRRLLFDYRVGDIFVPKVPVHEALDAMAADFVSAVTRGTVPISNSALGLEVVRILEASQLSIKAQGKVIRLEGAAVRP